MSKKKEKETHKPGSIRDVKIIRQYKYFDLIEYSMDDMEKGSAIKGLRGYQSKKGHFIDMQARSGRRPPIIRMIEKYGIFAEKISEDRYSCSIGRTEDGTWYGWSHRACFGFKPGRDMQFSVKGARKNMPFSSTSEQPIKTSAQARRSAIKFAKFVAS